MKVVSSIFLCVIAVVSLPLYADNPHGPQDFNSFDRQLNERDFDALKEYINTKRTIPLEEKDANLTISGDVRTEWRHMTESRDNVRLRGGDAGLLLPNGEPNEIDPLRVSKNDFDIEFNLRFDYVCNRGWAVAHLQFDNPAGVFGNGKGYLVDPEGCYGSGRCNEICLKSAYMGYNICCEGVSRFDVELGRRRLYGVFDSKVQFLSNFDGILLKYQDCWQNFSDWYIRGAGFLVDERSNHFAWVAELGFLDICCSGVDVKYSFIDWRLNGKNRFGIQDPIGWRYCNSQWTLYYHFNAELLNAPAQVYAAYIYNHCATSYVDEAGQKINDPAAYYVGFQVGQVVYAGDWAFEARYEVVGAQSIPDCDVSGIGRGNVQGTTYTGSGQGNVNYRGWRFEALYAITDNWTLDSIIEFSRQLKKEIGGKHEYSKFELEAIYAF